jgi:hypothetical protein
MTFVTCVMKADFLVSLRRCTWTWVWVGLQTLHGGGTSQGMVGVGLSGIETSHRGSCTDI